MRLVFVHGAPAAGKLTVAKALVRALPGRLFDNHAAIDLALTVFDFGAEGFWELVHDVRCSVIEAAAKQDVPLLVTTYCYTEPDDRPAFEDFEAILRRYDCELLPVYLHCSRDEAVRRLGNPDRKERRKLTSEAGLDDLLSRFDVTSIPHKNCLTIDTETMSPDDAAQAIIENFRLVGDVS